MARSAKELRGFLYNLRAIIDGFLKIIESTAMDPNDIETALFKAIASEESKGQRNEAP
jgi:hypothetical protein